jgi:hypothetical protein
MNMLVPCEKETLSCSGKFRSQMKRFKEDKPGNRLWPYGYVPTIMGPIDNVVQKTQTLYSIWVAR